jgi:DNA-binding protein HU-beta
VNKAQLIDALAERLGDRKVAAAAVAALLDVVIRTVNDGERVTITGFGVFEKRARAARTARNPRTGQAVTVRQTDVPAFRPGTLFREVVGGTRVLPDTDGASRTVGAPPVAGASSHSTTQVTAATRLDTAQTASAETPEVAKAAKDAKARKKNQKIKNAKTAEGKPKAKNNTPGSVKSAAKKAGKKSANKK